MAYPQDLLGVRVELYLSAAWVDITTRVHRPGNIIITRGRNTSQSVAPPSHCTLKLHNDGRFSPRNPLGIYYGQLTRNTPLRVSVNTGTGWQVRFIGEVAEWPQDPGRTGVLVLTTVTASGITRRLTQGVAPIRSALYRGIIDDTLLTGGETWYWSLEDGDLATEGLCDFGNSPPARGVSNAEPLFGRVDGPAGSDRLPDVSAQAALVAYPGRPVVETHKRQFEVWFRTSTGDSSGFGRCAVMQGDFEGGSITAFDALVDIGLGSGTPGLGRIAIDVAAYTGTPPGPGNRTAGLQVAVSGIPSTQGRWHYLSVTWDEGSTPGTIYLAVDLDYQPLGSITAAGTLGRAGRVILNPAADAGVEAYAGASGVGLHSVGHLTVKTEPSFGITKPSGDGWVGEQASARAQRLGDESDVTVTVPIATSELMGAQVAGKTLLDHLRDVEATDAGMLTEIRDALGYHYRPHSELQNQAATVTLNYGTVGHVGKPLGITDDDTTVRNDVTVRRLGGGFRRVEITTGTLSTQPPPAGVGTYPESVTLPCHTDGQAEQLAAWRAYLGTWDEPRVDTLTVSMAALGSAVGGAALIAAVLGIDLGDRIDLTGLPSWAPPSLPVLVTGYREVIEEVDWTFAFATTPAGPWDVGELGTNSLQTAGAKLNAAITTTTATSISVATTAGPIFSTTAPPPQIIIGGEVMGVTAVTGASSPQTFTVTRAQNGIAKTHLINTPVAVHRPLVLAL